MCTLLNILSRSSQTVIPAFLLLLVTSASHAAHRPVHIYALNQQSLPFEANDSSHQVIGFNIELIRQIGEVMGFDVEFRAMPWKEIPGRLKTGEVDMATMISSPERQLLYDFAEPHHVSPIAMFVRADDTEIYSLDDLHNLHNKEVITIAGDFSRYYLLNLSPELKTVTVADITAGLRRLAAGRHDAVVGLQSIGMYQVQQHKLTNLVLAGSISSPYSYSFAVGKGNRELLAQINQGLAILKRNGTFQQLHEKWLGGGRKAEQQKQVLMGFFALILLIVLMGGSLLWMWKTEDTREQLERAYHDALTALPSRTLLMDRLEHALSHAKRHQGRIAVLFIDLDGFKAVNDTLGHAAGDVLLQMVAKRLLSCVREIDTVARLGGDEFVIVLEHIGHAGEIDLVADRILDILQQPFVIANQSVCISGSLGSSLYPENGTDAATLLGHADDAMYQAKQHPDRRFASNVRHLAGDAAITPEAQTTSGADTR
nr:diguanylate cyclase [Oceanisphaera litoralis]